MPVWIEVPDLKKKIDLLLLRPGYFHFNQEKYDVIANRDSLVAAWNNINRSTLSRWEDSNRIRSEMVERFLRIFSIQRAWLSEPYDRFKTLCAGEPARPTWLALLAWAQDKDVGNIAQVEPPPPRALHAGRPRSRSRSLPVVSKGAVIDVSFKISTDWVGWHTALFSEDPNGFLCLLPRYVGEPEYPISLLRVPPKLSYDLPRLVVDEDVAGKHSFVLVATNKPLPPDLDKLLRQDREGKELEPTLDQLAGHLTPLCAVPNGSAAVGKPSAVVRRLHYSVV